MNFTYKGPVGGQINLWRRGRKHVAVFDGELPVSRMRSINREMLLAGDFSLPKGPHDRHSHPFVIGRAKSRREGSIMIVADPARWSQEAAKLSDAEAAASYADAMVPKPKLLAKVQDGRIFAILVLSLLMLYFIIWVLCALYGS